MTYFPSNVAETKVNNAIDWSQRVFEAEVVYQNPVLAFLTYDDEHHRFAFANLSALNPESSEVNPRDKGRRKSPGVHLRKSGRPA